MADRSRVMGSPTPSRAEILGELRRQIALNEYLWAELQKLRAQVTRYEIALTSREKSA